MLSLASRGRGVPPNQKKHARFSEPKKEKEKEKKYVSTNVVFKSGPDRVRKRAKADSTSGKKFDLGKSILTSRRRSESFHSHKKPTLASATNDVLNDYRAHVAADSEQVLARTYKDLVQRLEKSTLSPDALVTRIEQVTKVAQIITAPLASETIKARFADQNGNIARYEHVPIGDTIESLKVKVDDKKRELDDLWQQWDQVRQDIAEAGAQILHDPGFPVPFGLKAATYRPDPSSRLNQDVEEVRKMIRKEADRARKDVEQEAEDTKAAHRKQKSALTAYLEKMME